MAPRTRVTCGLCSARIKPTDDDPRMPRPHRSRKTGEPCERAPTRNRALGPEQRITQTWVYLAPADEAAAAALARDLGVASAADSVRVATSKLLRAAVRIYRDLPDARAALLRARLDAPAAVRFAREEMVDVAHDAAPASAFLAWLRLNADYYRAHVFARKAG